MNIDIVKQEIAAIEDEFERIKAHVEAGLEHAKTRRDQLVQRIGEIIHAHSGVTRSAWEIADKLLPQPPRAQYVVETEVNEALSFPVDHMIPAAIPSDAELAMSNANTGGERGDGEEAPYPSDTPLDLDLSTQAPAPVSATVEGSDAPQDAPTKEKEAAK